MTLSYDVLVIGAGHAGCEAACAAARLGASTCLVTMDMNKIAQMSCNPAVGGIAKGQMVREIDAMGGHMGLVTDATAIQFRMLNVGKGPAVWSPRAQCDRPRFILEWRRHLDATHNLDIWQDQAMELLTEQTTTAQTTVAGVRTIWGCELRARCVIVTAGTFLNGLLHIGRKMMPGGRIAEPAVAHFTESITRHGIRAGRMKTGTPVRIDRRTVHLEDMTPQHGEKRPYMFSYMHTTGTRLQAASDNGGGDCYEVYTNAEVHQTLRSALADSPLYNGQIQSIGPRYCPSIETKLVTFPERDHHLLFLEPEGTDTNEMYLNGFSSSLPMDVQLEALRHIPAFRDVKIYRPGYAIEYDFFDPTQLRHSLESKLVDGLFFAGQVNGTTGYEEAAAQGIIAGINAALKAGTTGSHLADTPSASSSTHSPAVNEGCGSHATPYPFTLARDEAYTGVLIDDLVTKGVDEPYRMFTSRAEYRILLRQDDADRRLTERAYNLGLATRQRYDHWMEKKQYIEEIEHFCKTFVVKPAHVNGALEAIGTTPLQHGTHLDELVARPQLSITILADLIPELREVVNHASNRRDEIAEAAEIRMKYRGYIERERVVADKMHRLENIRIRGHFNYNDIQSLSTEARQKLTAIDPETLAQASRIPGVSPSDINVLLVLMGR